MQKSENITIFCQLNMPTNEKCDICHYLILCIDYRIQKMSFAPFFNKVAPKILEILARKHNRATRDAV